MELAKAGWVVSHLLGLLENKLQPLERQISEHAANAGVIAKKWLTLTEVWLIYRDLSKNERKRVKDALDYFKSSNPDEVEERQIPCRSRDSKSQMRNSYAYPSDIVARAVQKVRRNARS